MGFWPSSSPSGWYNITVGTKLLRVWCDMTTDGGGYTYYPCDGGAAACPNASRTTDANGCKAIGMDMVIPRTQNHWASMFSFVTTTLGSPSRTYFAAIPGISKATSGANPCTGNITQTTKNGHDLFRPKLK